MDSYGFTPKYLTKNGQPWFPIMGEIHYSRYPAEFWRESLLKMRSGGVDIVSTYVIWIHHEEIEGEYDFSGNRDLRRFVEACRDCGLSLMLRIGPWCHGEVRNGGFPDWLLEKPFKLRENDREYFAAVRKFYRRIYGEVADLLLGPERGGGGSGPIVGLQIENEYGHCGGLGGDSGEEHMRTLERIAREEGFDVPLYTATGWGGAVTGGLIPVMGGYCEAPWDQRLTDIEPSGNYLFTHERNDHNIGSDFGFGTGITFDLSKFPYLTAELGGGLQVTRHRRPVARAADIGAMSLAKLGSGVNLLGYYMYHGGTNPRGRLTTLQETKDSGSVNDLPELSYDFRAPIREYGQISDTFREIRLFSLFLHDFGAGLCRMDAEIPLSNPARPSDREALRHSFRHDGKSGYLFVNNYQRRRRQAEHRAVSIRAPVGDVGFPPLTILDGEYFFLPFNMPVGDATLEWSLATPLCALKGKRPVYVFYAAFAEAEEILAAGKERELYRFENGKWPDDAEIRTITRREALDAWKIRLGPDEEALFIESGEVLSSEEDPSIGIDRVAVLRRGEGAPVASRPVGSADGVESYELAVPPWDGEDAFLAIAYEGESARLYESGVLVADNFFVGSEFPWEIGLKRFGRGKPHSFRLEIAPLSRDTPVFLESWPPLGADGVARRLVGATLIPQSRDTRRVGDLRLIR